MNKCINILISSVGRRVELVNLFKQTSNNLGIDSNIIGIDCNETAPALFFCDKKEICPRVTSDEYISFIIELCNNYQVDLIVPTIDTELLIYSKHKEQIEKNTKAKVLVSDYEIIKICRDKILTHDYLKTKNFNVAKLYTPEEALSNSLIYPLFVKPKDGSSSINCFKVETLKEMEIYLKLIQKPIIQSFMTGIEYTVDAFLDFDSNIISICPRRRIATRSGEISKGLIEKNELIINNVKKLLETLKPIGHITIQLMFENNDVNYIEINPRFGGGAPMSIQAGANSCEYLYKLLLGKTLTYKNDYKDKVLFLRFDSSIMVEND